MGRRQKDITDTGPVGSFANALRLYRRKTDLHRTRRITFRDMAKQGEFSLATYAEAEAGKKLPTQVVLEDYLRMLGANDSEIRYWKVKLHGAQNDWTAAVKEQAEARAEDVDRASRIRLVRSRVLRELYRGVGSPPFRVLISMFGQSEHYYYISQATVSNLLKGRFSPRPITAEAFIDACLTYARRDHIELPSQMNSWEAWLTRFEFAEYAASGPPYRSLIAIFGLGILLPNHPYDGFQSDLIDSYLDSPDSKRYWSPNLDSQARLASA